MKIAFFSGDTGKYSCFAALIMSIVIGEKFSLNTIMLQNKNFDESMEKFLEPSRRRNFFKEDNAYFALDGLDYLMWLCQNRRMSWIAVEEVAVPLCERAKFIPAGMREQSRLYPEKTKDVLCDIVKWMDKMTDVVLVDCGAQPDAFSENMKEDADVKVLCVKHDKEIIEDVLLNNKKWCDEEIILLMDYDFSSTYNKENISRIYRVPINRIATIPKNAELDSYMYEGRLQKFFRRNKIPFIGCHNSYYLGEILEASEKIMEVACGKMHKS